MNIRILGYLGIVLVQGATIPSTLSILMGNTANMPPISMIAMLWTGLLSYLIYSIVTKDRVWTLSNGIGFALQSILLGLIVTN